jgi:hypothetical protein
MHHETETARRIYRDLESMPSHNHGRKSPFVVKLEENCEDCGGSGYDCGGLSAIEPEDCPMCHGSGNQVKVRNYLAEALRIAAGKSNALAQREHLVAVIHHCRSLVSALMEIADIR